MAAWWLLPFWLLFGLSVGMLVGVVIRGFVSAMTVTGAVVAAFIAANYLLLPRILRIGDQVHRVVTRSTTAAFAASLTNLPAQFGWGLPAGSWVIRGWRAGGAADLAYQPPGHFWLFKGAEGVIVLGLTAICVAVALHWLSKRVSA